MRTFLLPRFPISEHEIRSWERQPLEVEDRVGLAARIAVSLDEAELDTLFCWCALVAFAASLSGRTAVALNFTVGRAALESSVRQASLQTVVTARAFVERLEPEVRAALDGVELVFLEDVLKGVGVLERLGGFENLLLRSAEPPCSTCTAHSRCSRWRRRRRSSDRQTTCWVR